MIKFLLCIWLTGVILFFFNFMFGSYNIKVTFYKTNQIYFLSGFKKILVCFLFALIWPYVVIKNIIDND